jgi:hypothetical protein
MASITVKTDDGFDIEVKRFPDGRILVRHTDKDLVKFGEFKRLSDLAKHPEAPHFLGVRGVYPNSEYGSQAMDILADWGFLIIEGEQIMVGGEDGKLIVDAIARLEQQEGLS